MNAFVEAALRDIRTRRRVCWSVILIGPVAIALSVPEPLFSGTLFVWGIAATATFLYAVLVPCPRCGQWFHDFWYFWGLWSLFRHRCAHCKLGLDGTG